MRIEGIQAERFAALVRAAVTKFGGQVPAARRLHLSQSYVSRVVRRKSPAPVEAETIMKVSALLGIQSHEWEEAPDEPADAWASRFLRHQHEKESVGHLQNMQSLIGSIAVRLLELPTPQSTEEVQAHAELARGLAKAYQNELGNFFAQKVIAAEDDDTARAMGVALAQWITRRRPS